VQFYSQDKFLIEELSEYVGSALQAGDAAIVVATEQHRNNLLQWLSVRGLDIAGLVEQGRFQMMDAAQLLSTIMSDGRPNGDRFKEVVGGIVAKALRVCERQPSASGNLR
jgi:KaiC/GvpD/RAD55 family RecA-like ATPase